MSTNSVKGRYKKENTLISLKLVGKEMKNGIRLYYAISLLLKYGDLIGKCYINYQITQQNTQQNTHQTKKYLYIQC